MSLVQTIAPASEPITLTEAKAHLRVETDFTEDDTIIGTFISAARESCEARTGRQLVTATYALRLGGFPCGDSIELPKPPLVSVTSITYVDTDGTTLDPDNRPTKWEHVKGVMIHLDDVHTGARRSAWVSAAEIAERKAKADEFGVFILQTTNEIENLRAELRALEGQEGTIKAKIDGIKAQTPDLSEIEQRKIAIRSEIDNIQASEQGMINEVQDKINEVKDRIMSLQEELQKVESNKAAEKRVAELQAQEKKLAGEFEKLESDLFKVENFIRAKVALLEARINGAFRLVRFKLFEDQINGGLTETCITTLNGVPYPSINNAGRIQAGMDIIKALQGHYGITAPVWIDNRESIVDLPEMPGQTISLIVSEKDGKLRIESENNKMQKAGGM